MKMNTFLGEDLFDFILFIYLRCKWSCHLSFLSYSLGNFANRCEKCTKTLDFCKFGSLYLFFQQEIQCEYE